MFRIMMLLALSLASIGRAQFCELVGYEIWGQDNATVARGTFLGLISTSTTGQYSIMNEFGDYGSSFSSKSIFNQFGAFGDGFSNTSAFNNLASKPPVIWEYRSPTDTYYKVGYLTTNSTLTPRYNPNILIPVLAFGNCNGCTPKIIFDTLMLSVHDTVIKRDTLSRIDTLLKVDTVKVAVHDTIRDCPAPIASNSKLRLESGRIVISPTGRFLGSCGN